MIFDAHNHIGKSINRLWSAGQTGEKLVQDMQLSGVDRAVAMPTLEYTDSIPASNDYVAEAVSKYPSKLVGFFTVSPWHAERALNEFDRCVSKLAMRGLKLHPTLHAYPLNSHTLVDPLFEKCAKSKLPVICHGMGENHYNTPSQFGEMADSFPEVTLVMAHMGFWIQMEDAIAKAKKYDNLYLETSYVPDVDIIQQAVMKCGADKVLMGSDTPGTSFELEIRKIQLAVPNQRERELVLGDNLARILDAKSE